MDVYLPDQSVSDKKKQTEEWYVPTYDYWIHHCSTSKVNQDTLDMIKVANGEINTSDLNYLLKPFNEEFDQLNEKYPIKARNTDIITPIVEKVMGEYIELPYKFVVSFHDPDISSMQDMELRIIMEDIIKSTIVENLQTKEENEPIDPKEIKAKIEDKKKEYIENEALKAKRYLEYINEKTDFDYYRYQMYYNWFTTEECYTYRTIEDGEFVKEIIPPQNAFPYNGNNEFVEDAPAFLWLESYTMDEIMLKDRDKLSKSQLDYLDNLVGLRAINAPVYAPAYLLDQRSMYNFYRINDASSIPNYLSESNRTLIKHNIVFISYRKVKELTYLDQTTGKEKTTIVPNDYSLSTQMGDLSVENKVIPEVYYGCRYGNDRTGIYTKPIKLLVQRDGKLPVTGKRGILKNKKINPVPYRLLAFQIIDIMLTIHIEKTLNKYKDDILFIPASVLAEDKGGNTTEKTYYMLKDGRLVYDDSRVDLQTVTQGLRLVQGSATDKYLKTLVELQYMFLQRANIAASFNDERAGNIDIRGGVGNVEQNIYRSKLANVLSLEVFRKILQKEHEADLEYGKYLFIDGVNDTMFDELGKVIQIEIDGYANFKRTFGVHVDNGINIEAKLNQIRQMAVQVAQGGDFDEAIEALQTDSIEEIKNAVTKMKDAKRQHEIMLQQEETKRIQMQNDAAKEQLDIAADIKEDQMILESELNENEIIVKEEYGLTRQQMQNETSEKTTEIDAETARLSNESRERIAEAKEQNSKEVAKIKDRSVKKKKENN